MISAALIHNPKAGDEAHTEEEIVSMIESEGIHCTYYSIKEKDWKKAELNYNFLIVAGGDGTVRKVTVNLLEGKLKNNLPIALLPAGTANNIAKTLGATGLTADIVRSWKEKNLKKFDVGKVNGVPDVGYFIEGFGFGVFPLLMREMKKQPDIDSANVKMELALELLAQIVDSYRPKYCSLQIDGKEYSGTFLLMEIMNIQAIGPNLLLSAESDPGDGEFEVVMIPESGREKFLEYLKRRLQGVNEAYAYDTFKGRNIKFKTEDQLLHADDELISQPHFDEISIELKDGLLEFLV